MEQARISTPPSPQGTAAAKGKATPAKNEGLTDAAPATGFLALLGLLGDVPAEEAPVLTDVLGAPTEPPSPKRKTAAVTGTDTDLTNMGVDTTMPWLLAGGAVLPAQSLPPSAESGSGQAAGKELTASLAAVAVGVSPAQPGLASVQGLDGQPTAKASALPAPLDQGEVLVGKALLASAQELPLDGLVSQTRQLDAVVEVEVRSSYATVGGTTYQSTVDKAKDLLSGAGVRGNHGASALGKATSDSAQGGALALSTTVASKVAERTVDPGQWALREGVRSESLRLETVGAVGVGLSGGASLEEGRIVGAASASTGGRGAEGQQGGGFSSAGGGDPLTPQGLVEAGGGAAEGFGLSPEDRVADQVSQWVGKTIHNAELTVGRESQAVQVTVTLSGQEAHVSFRTDEGQTRALLDAHLSELQEMLRNQGLELSGAWVGTSSQQQSGRDPGAPQSTMAWRSSSRLDMVTSAVSTPTAVRASRQSAGGGGLDVFV